MSKKSVIVWVSEESNEKINAEIEEINEGCTHRRGDWIMTKSERISRIIDEYYGVKVKEEKNHG